jgi:hypothetical protein
MNRLTLNTQSNIRALQNKGKVINYIYCPMFTTYYYDSKLTRVAGQLPLEAVAYDLNRIYAKVNVNNYTYFVNSNSIKVRAF